MGIIEDSIVAHWFVAARKKWDQACDNQQQSQQINKKNWKQMTQSTKWTNYWNSKSFKWHFCPIPG